MKVKYLLVAITIPMLIVFSCKKDDPPPVETKQTGITYPDSIYYGKSILSLPDSSVLARSFVYSFAANLEKDASLSIRITDLSAVDTNGYFAKWYYAFIPIGWTAQTWANGTQKFTATQKGKIDLQIKFESDTTESICRLDFYENSTSITKTKYLRW